MKFKKTWIFWICYYSAAIIGNVLAAVLLRDKWTFNGFSAFPIMYILFSFFWVWYFPSKHHANLCLNHDVRYLRSRDKYFDEEKWRAKCEAREQQENTQKKTKIGNKAITHTILFLTPFFGMYICFFSNLAKILSFVFPTIFLLIVMLVLLILFNDTPKFKKQREKELKEQQEREELGKWK